LAAQRPDSVRADSAARLPAVVTTVLRAPLPVVRAPYAVSTVTREAAQTARAGLAVDEALRGVPGVQVDNRFNAALGERISIRGFGARTQFGVRGVKVIVDGVPATMPDGQSSLNHVELGTLGRAEIERGPASALYGNASGGVVLLESAPPPDSVFGATLRALGGGNGLSRFQGTVGGRAGGAGWTLGASRLAYDGFRQWSDQRSTRLTGRADAGSASDGWGALRASAAWVDYDAHNPGSLSEALLAQDPTRAFANNVNQQTGEAGKHGQLGLGWTRALGVGEVEASAWGLRRRLSNPIPVSIVALDRRAGGARAAYTAAGAHERVTFGAELQRQRDDRQNFGNSAGTRGARTLDQLEHVTTGALFAQADATAGRFVALAGVRHDRVRFAADDRLVTATNPDDSGERTMSATTPSLGVSVALARAASLYANASTSFETPTTTELANRPTGAGGFNPDLDPQRARSLEAGLKGAAPLGARVVASWQLSAYNTQVTDALVPFEVPGAAGRQFYRNAGRARHRGVEASAEASLGTALLLRGAYTVVDARFREYTVRDTSYAGLRVPGVSPRRLDFTAMWRGTRGGLVALDLRAQDRMPANDANRAWAAGYALLDARASSGSYLLRGVGVAPFVGVTNVLDARYVTAVTVNAAGARYFEPGARRAFYVGTDVAVGRRGGR
jgi:iron complex outermembrane receptor protein